VVDSIHVLLLMTSISAALYIWKESLNSDGQRLHQYQ